MTEENLRIKIVDEYKNLFEKNKLGVEHIYLLLEMFDIDPCNPTTIKDAIKKLIEASEKIVIPKPIKELKSITRSEDLSYGIRGRKQYKTMKIYEHHTQKEVEQLEEKLKFFNNNFALLLGMLSITEIYSLSQSNSKGKTQNGKIERDTRPKKDKFIKLYLENSSKHKMHNEKIIAKLNKVSPSSVTRYFRQLKMVNEIHDELNESFTLLSDLQHKIESGIRSVHSFESTVNKLENVEFNFFYIREIKERLQRKIIPKASQALNKTKGNSSLN